MTRTDVTGLPASAVLRLGLLAGLLAAAGCSGGTVRSEGHSRRESSLRKANGRLPDENEDAGVERSTVASQQEAALNPSSPSDQPRREVDRRSSPRPG